MSLKQAIHERDRHRCMNCYATEEVAELLDVDHVVPRGVGGGEPISNQITLCRRCHDAKHGKRVAPTVRLESTGTMTELEFAWFRHFVDEMIPALARAVDVRTKPKYRLMNTEGWAIPLGDLRRMDSELSKADGQYQPLNAAAFM